ncbi:DNA topoisomerase [Vibrio owensii]|uniref:DNA topoisomerase n=1 Tax=Vibrio owensii TaxID=696485 RepID=UPI003CC59401
MTKLFVIEAFGKLDKLREILSEIYDEPFELFATKGRLYDLPEGNIGLDLSSKSLTEVPVSEYRINKLLEKLKRASEVYIATDNDIEGEKIALDVAKLSKGLTPYKRICFPSLSVSTLREAIDKPRSIDHYMVEAAKSKRFMDRYLGYSDSEVKANTGRVVSPVLAVASEEKQKTGVLAKTVKINREEFQLLVDLYGSTPAEVMDAARMLDTIEVGDQLAGSVIATTTKEDTASLWNGKQALLNISAALNMPLKDVEQHLQELYEAGRISYPRSDLNSVSKESALQVERTAQHWSIQNCSHEQILAKGESEMLKNKHIVQEGHEAIVPLDLEVNPFTKLEDLSPQDRVYSVLLRHSLRVAKANQVITKSEVSNVEVLERELKNKLRREDIHLKIIQRKAHVIGMMTSAPMYPEFMPCGIKKYDKAGSVKVRVIPKDQVVAKILYKNGLGRPSTFAYHAEKISKKFFKNDGTLNHRGENALRNTKRSIPELVKISSYHHLENNFMSSEKGYEEKIDLALQILGVDRQDNQGDKDQSIELNI